MCNDETIDFGLAQERNTLSSNTTAIEGVFEFSQFDRFEELRPIDCCLTCKDYTLLEGHLINALAAEWSYYPLLVRLIRTKLADARVILSDDMDQDVATGNSRVVFSLDGKHDDSRVLMHWDHAPMVGFGLRINTLLGATLLGMRAGQSAPLLRADGTFGYVNLKQVAFQPEAARRISSRHMDQG